MTHLIMDVYQGTNRSPVVKPGGVFSAQVDAAVTHGCAKIVVPVSAMQAIALIEIHDIGNAWQVVTRTAHGR